MKKILNERSGKHICMKIRKHFFLLFLLFIFLSILMFPACYHQPAIEGTPVGELVRQKDMDVIRPTIMSQEKKEKVRRMSRVTENKTFMEISGLPEYRVGPLDVLEIISHVGEKAVSTKVTVNSRGNISFSFIDNLNVNGLTPSQLDDLLTKRLSNYLRRPRIDIFVKEYQSKSAMVTGYLSSLQSSTLGKAASGRIFLKGKTTLLDLIALAGGYTIDADIRKVKLVRGGETYFINLYDIISRGESDQNVIIDADDVVDVPELPTFGDRVYVLGEVARQGIYPLKQVQDLLGAISLAGSFTAAAKEENTLIVRGYEPGKEPLVMMADLNAILRKADIKQNIPLENGDLVYVPPRKIGDVNRWIANIKPLLDILLWPGDFAQKYGEGYRIKVD